MSDSTEFVLFILEHPFTGDDSAILGTRNKGPGVVLDDRVIFLLN